MRFALACSCTCLLALSASGQILQGFHPDHQQAVRLITPEFTAELIPKPRDARTGESHSIFRINKHGRQSYVALPFEFYQVNAILQGVSGKLLVVGMQAGEIYQIGIVNIAESRLVDHFTCYGPAPSPDGRYIAYTKFFAPHGTPSPDDHAMLYDVGKSPSENRPEGIRLDDYIDVGFVLYPPGSSNREADNVDVPLSLVNVIGGRYFWRDPNLYLFGDWKAGEFRIIQVTIGSGVASVRSLLLTQSQIGGIHGDLLIRLVDARFQDHKVSLDVYSNAPHYITVNLEDFGSVGSVNLGIRPMASP